jgi:hypothetical protein
MSIDVLIEGRLVCGHPMTRRPVKKRDPITKVETPVINADGTPVTDVYVGIAIPKLTESDWKQSAWGQQFYAAGVQDWPNGEHGSPTFAWKVTDGDSQVPNQKGKKPCDREGWPGHWIVHCTTQFHVSCFHVGKYDPLEQIQVDKEIKTGDYARVLVNVKGNGPSQSPGIYVNPTKFELSRAGAVIISESGPSAAEVFGGAPLPGSAPGTASAAHIMAPPPTTGPGIAPAPDFLKPEMSMLDGKTYTAEQLKASGWTDQQIATLPKAT